MEQVLFEIMSEHLSVEGIILIVQLLFVIYVVHGLIVLFMKNFGNRWIAFKDFKNNMLLGIGTKVTIEVARSQFTGHIQSANKDKVVISNGEDLVVMDIRKFMDSSVIIHDTGK